MNNFERIRNMSIEELATFLLKLEQHIKWRDDPMDDSECFRVIVEEAEGVEEAGEYNHYTFRLLEGDS